MQELSSFDTTSHSISSLGERVTFLAWSVLAASFFATAPVVDSAVTTLGALLALFALFAGWRGFHRFSRLGRVVAAAFLIYLASALLSLLNNHDWDTAGWRFERYHPFLFAVFMLALMSQWRERNWFVLILGLGLGAMLTGAFGIYQGVFMGETRVGAGTGLNPNIYGHLAFVIGNVLLAAAVFWKASVWARFLLLVLGLWAALAGFESGSRGGLLAFGGGLFATWLAGLLVTNRRRGWVWAGLGGMLTMFSGLVLMVALDPFWSAHVERAIADTQRFLAGEVQMGSIGIRLSAWLGAWEIWLQHPWIGTGIGDGQNDLDSLILAGKVPLDVSLAIFHNSYLDILATTGVAGFAAMLFGLFLVPFHVFWQALRKSDAGSVASAAGACGVVLLANLAVFALTNSWLHLRGLPFVLVLLVYLLVSTGLLSRAAEAKVNESGQSRSW